MKRLPVFTSILLIAGVLATMGFTRPLQVRNGIVVDYAQGGSLTIKDHSGYQTYLLGGTNGVFPQSAANGLGTGARVTVFAQCFGVSRNSGTGSGNAQNGRAQANDRLCVALGVLVRAPAQGGTIPATGGSGGTTGATSTATATTSTGGSGATGATATVVATETPSAGGTGGTTGTGTAVATGTGTAVGVGTGTATPMCLPAMPTATLSSGGTAPTATMTTTPFIICTPTPSATATP